MDVQRQGRVAGKTTIITGAAKGIGAGCARVFAREGARLVLVDIDGAALDALAEQLRADGVEVYAELADIAEEEQIARVVKRAEEVGGRLDILVNNAAIIPVNTIEDTTNEEWDAVMRINMRGTFLASKLAVTAMKRGGGGAIVNMSSISALVGLREQAAYAPSKAYVHELTKQLALDYAPHNIRVNAVCPGTIMTAAIERLQATHPDPKALIGGWLAGHPMGRVGQPEEVGWAVLFLASDEASFITGAFLSVDGGYTAQ